MKPALVINGAAGRMGKRIVALAVESEKFSIEAAVDAPSHPDMGKDIGTLAGIGELGVNLTGKHADSGDVMIDFSLPQATDAAVKYCVDNNVALVLGTTGLNLKQMEMIADAAERIPVIQATNYSVGMNVLFNVVGKVAKMLGEDYDVEIIEAHHKHKKDSPSGTAITLAENIAEETGRSCPDCLTHGRFGTDALREKGEIGMHAVRGGEITGEHTVLYAGPGEMVKIFHSAHNRDNFVRGAIRAAAWLVGKAPGMYSMTDVLGM